MSTKIRVRFAPSPTGFMHLGNVRAALLNYLFARQHKGTFVLRIEDTDNARNTNASFQQILEDLAWLGLHYDEGPHRNGNYGPYLQSQRTNLYEEKLLEFAKMNRAYRCFCSIERLENMREKQVAMKKPPRYDRTCLNLSSDCIRQKMETNQPYIWRFRINEHQVLTLNTIAGKTHSFDMQHFADFAITRQDGSFTFIFSNFVDDVLMEISHVIRGEDHLSNTALQLAMYDALACTAPRYLHLPMICNDKGEKLSKRDFGFALRDLQAAGFLPQAICNYLAIIGTSVEQEIQTLNELVQNSNFDHTPSGRLLIIPSGGAIKYDLEKLRWVNQQWISKLPTEQLLEQIKHFLFQDLPEARIIGDLKLVHLIKLIMPELKTLKEASALLAFYVREPETSLAALKDHVGNQTDQALELLKKSIHLASNTDAFLGELKEQSKKLNIPLKAIYSSLRYICTGSFNGLGIKDLCQLLEPQVIAQRIQQIV